MFLDNFEHNVLICIHVLNVVINIFYLLTLSSGFMNAIRIRRSVIIDFSQILL